VTSVLEVESTITDRYQTTVPEAVRRALKLGKRDKVHYSIRPNGEVVLKRAVPAEEGDPVLDAFLGFLAQDMVNHPDRLQPIDGDLAQRIQALVGNVEVELDVVLPDEDE